MEIFIILAFIAGVAFFSNAQKKKYRNELKMRYDAALRGTDKQLALRCGRDYYSSFRKGSLTMYDEQAITNDLSTMR